MTVVKPPGTGLWRPVKGVATTKLSFSDNQNL